MSDEFTRIARYFAPLATASGAFQLTDDAAVFGLEPGEQAVVTTDALVAGVHFVGDEPAGLIGRKALRTNLSDLAAMGARPVGYTLAAVLPRGTDDAWLADLAAGLALDQAEFGIPLLGGDTVATPGPLTLSITAIGAAATVLRRSGARVGDAVCVSGTIGDAALGLAVLQGRAPAALGEAERVVLVDRYRLPRPRLGLGRALAGLATAALDVSDGLVADLGHITATSGVAAAIRLDQVPLSPAGRAALAAGADPAVILAGGDDYELLFTVPQEKHDIVGKCASDLGVPVTVIGTVQAGSGVTVRDREGRDVTPETAGYRHF